MPEKTEIEADAAAEKAYAAAAETVTAKTPAPAAVEAAPEVEFPSKAKRAVKAKAEAPAPVAEAPKAPAAPAPVVSAPVAKAAPARRATAKPAVAKKPVRAKRIAKPKAQPAKAQSAKTKPKARTTPKAAAPKTVAQKTLFQQLKDKTMDTAEFTTKIKSAVTEAQVKAKEAFDKGAATFTEYNEFSKGNVEAVVASGKILATGFQSLGKTFVEDGKNAIEILTAEVKELATVKSPADFFKLQVEFLRRNFDTAVSTTSKNSEAVLKLANEAAAPISARVNLAVEKLKKAA